MKLVDIKKHRISKDSKVIIDLLSDSVVYKSDAGFYIGKNSCCVGIIRYDSLWLITTTIIINDVNCDDLLKLVNHFFVQFGISIRFISCTDFFAKELNIPNLVKLYQL